MEIEFCDRCGSSIPRSDRERGAATERNGRLLCAPCRSGDRRRAAVRAAVLPLGFLLAAAAGAAAAVLVLSPRIRAVEERRADQAVPPAAPEPGLRAEIEGILAILRARPDALEALSGRLDDDRRAVEDAFAGVNDRIDAVAEELRIVKERLRQELEAAPAAPAGDPGPPPGPDLGTWLPLLDDEDPGVRLSALVALEDATDGEVRTRARARLDDPDPLVRAQAARMAGRWGDHSAVAALARLLSDPNVRVRSVAHGALAEMLGPVAGYDPTDPEDAREAAARAFRETLK